MSLSRSPATSWAAGAAAAREDQYSAAGTASPPTTTTAPTTKSGKTPSSHRHVCKYCSTAFSKSEHLKRHERSHTREKPYVCECGKKFSRADSLTRHLRLHEPDADSKFSKIAISAAAMAAGRTAQAKLSLKQDNNEDEDDESDEEEAVDSTLLDQSESRRDPPSTQRPTKRARTRPPPPPPPATAAAAANPYIDDDLLDPLLRDSDAQAASMPAVTLASLAFSTGSGNNARSYQMDRPTADRRESSQSNGGDYSMYASAMPISYDRGFGEVDPSLQSHNAVQVPRSFTPYLSTAPITDYSSVGPSYIDPSRAPDGGRDASRHRSIETPAALHAAPFLNNNSTTVWSTGSVIPSNAVTRSAAETQGGGGSSIQTGLPYAISAARSARPPTINLNPNLTPSASSSHDESYATTDGVSLWNEFGGDLDLLELLASDTSLAFPHTILPQFTTFTTNPPSDGFAEPLGIFEDMSALQGMFPATAGANGHTPENERLWNRMAALASASGEATLPHSREDSENKPPPSGRQAAGTISTEPSLQREPSRDARNHQVTSQDSDWAQSKSQQRANDAINEAKSLIADLSFSLAADTSPLSSQFLEQCLNSFFNRFLPTFAVVHRSTFSVRNTFAPLLINMLALGSLFIPTADAKQKGEALWRLVHKSIGASWDRLLDVRNSEHDASRGIPLVQAVLLGTLYAITSSRRSIRLSPFAFKGLGFRLARIGGMFDHPTAAAECVLPEADASPVELDAAWRKWASQETALRTLLGFYLVDGQLYTMYNCTASVRHICSPLISVCEDAVWNAPTAKRWHQAITARRNSASAHNRKHMPFIRMFKLLLSPEQSATDVVLDPELPTMTRVVLLVGLQSLVAEMTETKEFPMSNTMARNVALALQRYRHTFIDPLSNPLETFGLDMAWQSISISLIQSQVVDSRPRIGSDGLDGPNYQISFADPDLGWTRTSCGNRMLLHAAAIRQSVEAQSLTTPTTPQFYSINFLHLAALIFVAWMRGNRDLQVTANSHRPRYNLKTRVDWNELGLVGLPDIADSTHSAISFGSQGEDSDTRGFILTGATALMGDRPLRISDANIFVEELRMYGKVWRVALKYAEELTELIAETEAVM